MKRLYLSLLLTLSVIGLFGQGAIYTRNIIIDKATPVLFLKGNGGIIDFNTGSITLTQSVNKLTIAGGTLDLTTLPTVNNVTFKTSLSLTATDVGLGNVTNESKATMFTSPMITGTPTIAGYVPTSRTINGHDLTGNVSVTTTDLSLQNVTNESKATMFTSPTFTNAVTIPTPFTIGTVSMTTTGTKLNYLTSAGGTTGTTSTNLVFSTSPALTTPTVVTSIVGDATFAAFNTVSTALSIGGAATTLTVGGTPTTSVTHSYSANATANGATKTVNIGTGGVSGSTSNINVGSVEGGTTTINSPTLALGSGSFTLTGSIAATGARVTKGWFTDLESTNRPTFNGTGLVSVGDTATMLTKYARKASPTFTGVVNASTLALGTGSITMTGSLGTTGARLTKGWFEDLEVTNYIDASTIYNKLLPDSVQKTGNFTLSLTDANKDIYCVTDAINVITIPANATAAIPIGTTINFYGEAGIMVFKAAANVHLHSDLDSIATSRQHQVAGLKKRGTNYWILYGHLTD